MACELVVVSMRKEGLTHEEFIEYFEREYAPLIEELPGLKRFVTSEPLDPHRIGSVVGTAGTRVDIISRLQFENLYDLRRALCSKEARRLQQDYLTFGDNREIIDFALDTETLRYQAIPAHL